MKTRKLMHQRSLHEWYRLADLGVPINRIIRDNQLDISGPHLNKLIVIYGNLFLAEDLVTTKAKDVIHSSLFPEWLEDNDTVQEQPTNYNYSGRFPYGTWEQLEG